MESEVTKAGLLFPSSSASYSTILDCILIPGQAKLLDKLSSGMVCSHRMGAKYSHR